MAPLFYDLSGRRGTCLATSYWGWYKWTADLSAGVTLPFRSRVQKSVRLLRRFLDHPSNGRKIAMMCMLHGTPLIPPGMQSPLSSLIHSLRSGPLVVIPFRTPAATTGRDLRDRDIADCTALGHKHRLTVPLGAFQTDGFDPFNVFHLAFPLSASARRRCFLPSSLSLSLFPELSTTFNRVRGSHPSEWPLSFSLCSGPRSESRLETEARDETSSALKSRLPIQ